jgi:hypothetical protein
MPVTLMTDAWRERATCDSDRLIVEEDLADFFPCQPASNASGKGGAADEPDEGPLASASALATTARFHAISVPLLAVTLVAHKSGPARWAALATLPGIA